MNRENIGHKIASLRKLCRETRSSGIACDMRLGATREEAERVAGRWSISLKVETLEALLDAASAALECGYGD